jgi:hypothetical protein
LYEFLFTTELAEHTGQKKNIFHLSYLLMQFSVLCVVNDFRFLNLIFLIPPIVDLAEIMPDFLSAKSTEIIDSCVLSEIVFTGLPVNKIKQ